MNLTNALLLWLAVALVLAWKPEIVFRFSGGPVMHQPSYIVRLVVVVLGLFATGIGFAVVGGIFYGIGWLMMMLGKAVLFLGGLMALPIWSLIS